jgi:hypothetical protein
MVAIGMATIFLRMAYGSPPEMPAGDRAGDGRAALTTHRESLWSVAPAIALGLTVLALGVYVPPRLTDLLHQAVTDLLPAVAALGAN